MTGFDGAVIALLASSVTGSDMNDALVGVYSSVDSSCDVSFGLQWTLQGVGYWVRNILPSQNKQQEKPNSLLVAWH